MRVGKFSFAGRKKMSKFESLFSSRDFMTALCKFLTLEEVLNVTNVSKRVAKNPYYSDQHVYYNSPKYKFLTSKPNQIKFTNATLHTNTLENLDVPASVNKVVLHSRKSEDHKVNEVICPINVKSADINNCVFDPNGVVFSEAIEEICLYYCVFNAPTFHLPSSLRMLTLDCGFCDIINLDEIALPASLEYLKFCEDCCKNLDVLKTTPNLKTLITVKSYGSRNPELGPRYLPDKLETLEMSGHLFPPTVLLQTKLPDSLKSLKLPEYFNGDLDQLTFPPNLESLTIVESLTRATKLPASLIDLTIDGAYMLDASLVLPEKLENLSIAVFRTCNPIAMINKIIHIEPNQVLKVLKITNRAILSLKNTKFPPSTVFDFGREVMIIDTENVTLPRLETLTCNISETYIDSLKLPLTLKTLCLHESHKRNIQSICSLENLQDLKITGNCRGSQRFPPYLQTLDISVETIEPMAPLPVSLQKLTIKGKRFQQSIMLFSHSLVYLDIAFEKRSFPCFDKNIFPPNLKELRITAGPDNRKLFHSEMNFPQKLEVLLTELEPINNCYEKFYNRTLELDYKRLPPSLKILDSHCIIPLEQDFATYLPNLEEFGTTINPVYKNTVFPPNIPHLRVYLDKTPTDEPTTITFPTNAKSIAIYNYSSNVQCVLPSVLNELKLDDICIRDVRSVIEHVKHIGLLELNSVHNRYFNPYILEICNVEKFVIQYLDFTCNINYTFCEPLRILDIDHSLCVPDTWTLPKTLEEIAIKGYKGSMTPFNSLPKLRKLEIPKVDFETLKVPNGTLVTSLNNKYTTIIRN